MRKVIYGVAASLDGFIAGPHGEADWIVEESEIDFEAIFARYDTLAMGSRTFEEMVRQGQANFPGVRMCVFSRRLRPEDYPGVEIIAADAGETVRAMREMPGKDIWLFGGGELFRSLLKEGLVDGLEIGLIPVLLGSGVPLLPGMERFVKLKLTGQRAYRSGIVWLEYDVERGMA